MITHAELEALVLPVSSLPGFVGQGFLNMANDDDFIRVTMWMAKKLGLDASSGVLWERGMWGEDSPDGWVLTVSSTSHPCRQRGIDDSDTWFSGRTLIGHGGRIYLSETYCMPGYIFVRPLAIINQNDDRILPNNSFYVDRLALAFTAADVGAR